MADILAGMIFFALSILWIVVVIFPFGILCLVATILYVLTSWRVFDKMAVAAEKLVLKVYLLIRYITTTWLTEEEISKMESELDIFHKDS